MLSSKVKIIAEAGVNHNGNMTYAKKLIDAAKHCGADYIKFRNISFANTTAINDDTFGQSDHSYYFYFGLEPK